MSEGRMKKFIKTLWIFLKLKAGEIGGFCIALLIGSRKHREDWHDCRCFQRGWPGLISHEIIGVFIMIILFAIACILFVHLLEYIGWLIAQIFNKKCELMNPDADKGCAIYAIMTTMISIAGLIAFFIAYLFQIWIRDNWRKAKEDANK